MSPLTLGGSGFQTRPLVDTVGVICVVTFRWISHFHKQFILMKAKVLSLSLNSTLSLTTTLKNEKTYELFSGVQKKRILRNAKYYDAVRIEFVHKKICLYQIRSLFSLKSVPRTCSDNFTSKRPKAKHSLFIVQ